MQKKIFSFVLLFSLLMSPIRTNAQAKVIGPTMAISSLIAGTGFVTSLVMIIVFGDELTKATTSDDLQRWNKATGLQAGSLVASLGTAVASVFTIYASRNSDTLSNSAKITIPLGLALTAGTAVMDAIAGSQLDGIAGANARQREKAHTLAVADYVFAALAAANLIPYAVVIGCHLHHRNH